ncbi:MAG: hypothetical protein HGA41_10630 [Syntrophaceae bacterium]|nr:hypothetical protein [Syntrophaceae bacterium]NTW65241.1 hypothetical protein [Nitrospirota bacterium]
MMRIPQGWAVSFLREKGHFMKKGKEKLLNALSYFTVLAIAFSFLAFASMGGYLYGSAQTARSYEAVFKEFTDNVESRQIFYFHGYKVVPKEKVIVVKVKPQKLAELAESRGAGLDKTRDQFVSKQAAGSGQQVKISTSSKTITRSSFLY